MRILPPSIRARPASEAAHQTEQATPQTSRSPQRVLVFAACAALAAALGEAVVRLVHTAVPHHQGWPGALVPEVFWISALVNLVLFLALAVVLIVAERLVLLPVRLLLDRVRVLDRVRRLAARVRLDVVAAALFAVAAVCAVVFAFQDAYFWIIYPPALAILCVGVAVFIARTLARRPPVAQSAARRALLRFAAATAVVNVAGIALGRGPARTLGSVPNVHGGLGSLLSASVSGRDLPNAAPATAQARPPNVLLIVLDTLRADHLGVYGYPRATSPNIDRIAAQGTLFERAYSTASWTLPSHASMFTARRLNEHLALVTPMDTRYPTLAEFLAERGYTTAGFVANLSQTQRATGLGRGFQLYEDYYGDIWSMVRASGYGSVASDSLPYERYGVLEEKDSATVVAQFSRWLPSRPAAPFFAFLNFIDVHEPYAPPPPYNRLFTDTPPGASMARPRMRPIVRNLNPYDGELAYMDAQLGVLFETLAAQDVLDDTLIFIVSDHGEEFGEHSEGGHGHTVHRELLHVPLIVRYPATVPVGRRLAATVSLQDLAPTVLELTGLQSGSPFPGTSLVVEWAGRPGGEPPLPRIAFSELMGYRSRNAGYSKSLFTDDWHLIVNEKTRRPSLYDAVRDPLEQDDLWESEMGRKVIATLGRHLEALLPPDQWQVYREFVLPDED